MSYFNLTAYKYILILLYKIIAVFYVYKNSKVWSQHYNNRILNPKKKSEKNARTIILIFDLTKLDYEDMVTYKMDLYFYNL